MAVPPSPYDFLPSVASFTVSSDSVVTGQILPNAQVSGIMGAGGEDVSPHLAWSGFPEATRGFAVTCFDPDAPTASGFWHWAVCDIPIDTTELPAGAGSGEPNSGLPAAAITLRNDAGSKRFIGAAPPPGHGPHRYMFVVHALDVESLGIDDSATPAFLGFNLFFRSIGRALITPIYEQL
ncbi:YbhB/YbcL family Raf kinase inhibitor-like protein [Spiractinospora alimapuensis]|uniref:YbhB/YbcL family Raf kinase inhibitor-like protein n=1 Tax=Spiractinospora alimapuensis TaxID=2820884 RepID=UPI001F2AA008|nr:YbhB/YbcL family Raf kinase inhibitor-like protein [Spiractinospora alimapuensis]QVQ53526.1 YbhB/YbcL family Raf kinase inhibitor-like protein [Spiractinospora alimapuensis]